MGTPTIFGIGEAAWFYIKRLNPQRFSRKASGGNKTATPPIWSP
jgi:hypothetical protein